MPCSTAISCNAAGVGSNCSAGPRNTTRATTGPIRPAGDYVQHLRLWYAQSHPDEDFAETFAVWLRPRSNWRTRYAGWPALKKLEYVDELMDEIAGKRPLVTTRERVDPLHELSQTIGDTTEEAGVLRFQAAEDLRPGSLPAVFRRSRHRRRPPASAFIRRHHATSGSWLRRWTGELFCTSET